MRIAIDLMGSDASPQALLEAVSHAHHECGSHCELVVVGDPSICSACQGVEPVVADESIAMDESPLLAVRRKRNSSMAVGMRLLKEGKIDGFISTGNTGALIASAMVHLKKMPTIQRPAFLVMMPTQTGGVAVLDVGANIHAKARHFVDYARMGASFRNHLHGVAKPSIGLLNIGSEEEKGTVLMKEVYRELQEHFAEQFVGNVEGRDVFHGKVDVLVTDGFTGNVFLKTCEGASAFFSDFLRDNFSSPIMGPILGKLYQKFNYSKHPGALLAGVDGLVMKCHGYSDKTALVNGIHGAIKFVEKNLISKMRAALAS